MESTIGWILAVTGAITAAAGLATLLFPRPLLRVVFDIECIDGSMMFFVRHWSVLIFVVGALLVYSALYAQARVPILTAAAVEKIAVAVLIFFGPAKATTMMKGAAIVDGLFGVIYVSYLVSLYGSSNIAPR